jgi:U3 small nucleolar RNA-associated protein 5
MISGHGVFICLQSVLNKRYVEPKSVGLGFGFDIDQGEEPEASRGQQDANGDLQLDLAEMSLGQRLRAVTESRLNAGSDSEGDHAKNSFQRTKPAKKSSRDKTSMIPVNSLTRTLIQALHSSDSRLLEMCLAHSEPLLIRNTVRRLPPQLAVPLITACVERLGRGPRAANMKGTAIGASSQRGSGLLAWLTTVLAVHTGHLMTV